QKGRGREVEDGVHDLPLRFDGILATKQVGVALHRVTEQPFVRKHVARLLLPGQKLRVAADHRLAWALDAHADGHRGDGGPDANTAVLARRCVLVVDVAAGSFELDSDLDRPLRKTLTGADEERHTRPAVVVDMELHGRERLDRRVTSDAGLVTIAAK